jgi:hypothetical protein
MFVMRLRLRTLLVVLLLAPPLLALCFGIFEESRNRAWNYIVVSFAVVPQEDSALTQWLSAQTNIRNVRVSRRPDPANSERQQILILFEALAPVFRGSPADPDVEAAFQRLGYAVPERARRDRW